MTTEQIPEPREHTFVCWFDSADEPHGVFWRTDAHTDEQANPEQRWYDASPWSAFALGDGPMTWAELLDEMEGSRGPVELVRRTGVEFVPAPEDDDEESW